VAQWQTHRDGLNIHDGESVGSIPTLTSKIKVMKHEKWFNGFMWGFFIGGIVGIAVLTLAQQGIL
jgi:hypothetical protein